MCKEGVLVETGDRIEDVYERCGEPSWQRVTILHNRRNRSIRTELVEWIYDLGEGTFPHYLRFYNGTLDIVEERSRWP